MHKQSHDGKEAENSVAAYLEKQGFTILHRNYRKMYGEVDLIARSSKVMAFVEVKMRRSNVIPMTALIGPAKQKRIIAVAREFITKHYDECKKLVCRFDVALVYQESAQEEITYISDAFTESEGSYHDSSF